MISAVAEMYGIHPQTLRLYEREGLLKPSRTEGNTRLYTDEDLERLELILSLARDLGVNISGIAIILQMRERMDEMQRQMAEFVDGVGISIGGGFHHAFPGHGEGFCMINDVAVAIRRMQREDRIRTAMTVDCDVHQGNGTAVIFSGTRIPSEPGSATFSSVLSSARPAPPGMRPRSTPTTDVFTISLHQLNNYPSFKPPSSLDLNLPDGLGDADYLACLGNALSMGLNKFQPELICYLAGADPYCEDQLGGLSLTIEGLKQRDALVFQIAKAEGIPVMVTLAGGYAMKLEDTITIHCNTVIAAKEVFAVT
jgi:acetoin utilization deacetylase AcuC-like enzyme